MVTPPEPHPSVLALKQQGDKAYAARDFPSAIERYSEALESVEDAVVLSNRSASHAQRRQFGKALVDAERALKLKPRWPRLYHRLGHALFHQGQYAEAIQAFLRGLELDPDDGQLREALDKAADYTVGISGARPGTPYRPWAEWDGSKECKNTPATSSSQGGMSPEVEALDVLGEWMYGTQGKSYHIKKGDDGLLRYVGPHVRVKEVIGTLHHRNGNLLESSLLAPDGEVVGLIRLKVTEPGETIVSNYRSQANSEWGKDIIAHRGRTVSADELREQGNTLFRQGKHAPAMKCYTDALAMNPNDVKSYSNRAAAQMGMLRNHCSNLTADKISKNPYYESAKGDLEECLRIDPKFIKAYARKGELLRMSGDVRQAMNEYQRGLDFDPENADCRAGKAACEQYLWG